jgi:membrane-associated phospholipid phosphatase
MFLLHSMLQVSLYTAVAVGFLVWLALRINPLIAARSLWISITKSTKFAFHLAAMLAVLFFNKIEMYIDERMQGNVDFTPKIASLEKNIVLYIQQMFEAEWLTYFLSYSYVILFPAVMLASVIIYLHRDQPKLYYAVCYALMMNYMLAVPFYLFFPVNEVHSYHPQVQFLMLDVFPTFESTYRQLSALNNCFPSLHTSISVSMAWIAYHSGDRFWRWFTIVHAAIIIFSIFYLGIHWVSDMFAGIVLGWLASYTALRITEGHSAYQVPALPYGHKRDLSKW